MASTIYTALALMALIPTAIFSQSPAFEAASVKRTDPGRPVSWPVMAGGPGSKDPGRIAYSDVSLDALLLRAYGLKQFQLSAPDWVLEGRDRFDIAAVLPPDTTEDRFRVMLQNLLTERFRMKSHRQVQEMTVLNLEVSKGGPKLRTGTPPAIPSASPATVTVYPIGPMIRIVGRSVPISALSDFLAQYLKRPVFDITGLQGVYDIDLNFQSDTSAEADGPVGDSLFTVLKTQCGLDLKSEKGHVEMFIVDQAERTPVEN